MIEYAKSAIKRFAMAYAGAAVAGYLNGVQGIGDLAMFGLFAGIIAAVVVTGAEYGINYLKDFVN